MEPIDYQAGRPDGRRRATPDDLVAAERVWAAGANPGKGPMQTLDYRPPPERKPWTTRRVIALVVIILVPLNVAVIVRARVAHNSAVQSASALATMMRAQAVASAATARRAADKTPLYSTATAPVYDAFPDLAATVANGHVRIHVSGRSREALDLGSPGVRLYVTGVDTRQTAAVPLPDRPTVLRYGESADLVSDPLPAGFVPAAAWVELRTPDGSHAVGIDLSRPDR